MSTPERARSGLLPILVATAVAGLLGYVIQLLAPALLADADDYLAFSVFWSALYLAVTALSGIQQEVTRAAHPAAHEPPSRTLRDFTLLVIGVVIAAVAVLTAVFGALVFPVQTWALAGWLAVGLVGYVVTAALSGVLYGLSLWREIAALTIVDAVVRALLVVAGLVLGLDPVWIAGLVAVPFILAFGLVWLAVRRRVVGAFRLDVGWRRLTTNSLGTVVASTATGAMITGLPLFLRLTTPGTDATALAGVILAITITRAPFIVPLMALQSWLITVFKASKRSLTRPVLLAIAAGLGITALAAVVGWLLGPWLVEVVSAGRYAVPADLMAAIVASACLVALMAVTGPALLSRSRHVPYVAGWVVAALATVAILVTPLPLEPRLVAALLIPPVIGIAVHLVAVARGLHAPEASTSSQGPPVD